MQCARHPDIAADGTCQRCGDYVCRGCRHGPHPELCTRCGDRLPRGIPWEDRRYGVLPLRFLQTLRDVFVRPKIAFPGPARVGPASAFALCVALVSVLGWAAIAYWTGEGRGAMALGHALVGSAVAVPVITAAVVLVQSASFAAGLAAVGRRHGLWRFSMRAAGYASPIFWAGFFAAALGTFALGAGERAWVVELVVWALLTGRIYVHAGRGLGLPTRTALVAAVGPTVLCAVPAALLAYEMLILP